MAGAAFLSYASQDSDAARKICDSLREAGCEVWIDQSELHGGDAWDAKIRGQIRECSLFVPLISANSNARLEGYFRREWKLAVERTHDMDESLPFLVPVVIDETTDATARVPEKFRHHQWTRLPGGAVPPAFVSRIKALLEGGPADAVRGAEARPPSNPTAGKALPRWPFVLAAIVLLAGAFAIWRVWGGRPPVPRPAVAGEAPVSPPPVAPESRSSPRAGAPMHPVNHDSVAVLPFSHAGAEKDDASFADGICEDLTDRLARVPNLRVSGSSSAFSFRGKQSPLSEIAKSLGVTFVLEGSVEGTGGRLKMTAQLVRASDGVVVGEDKFDRDMKDAAVVEDEIAGLVAGSLHLPLDAGSPKPGVDPEAYRLFLVGRGRSVHADDAAAALDLYRRAAGIDPNRAAIWTQIARADLRMVAREEVDPGKGFAEARLAVEKALALDRDSPTVLVTAGRVRRMADWDWKGARQAVGRALELEPGNPQALAEATVLQFNADLPDEAARDARKAADIDPLSAAPNITLCLLLRCEGQLKRAEQAVRRALMLAPDTLRYHGMLSTILNDLGRPNDARQEALLERDPAAQKAAFARIAVVHGAKERAIALSRQLEALAHEAKGEASCHCDAAGIYASLDESDLAFTALTQAIGAREPGLAWLKGNPELAKLRGDARWAGVLGKMGLPTGPPK